MNLRRHTSHKIKFRVGAAGRLYDVNMLNGTVSWFEYGKTQTTTYRIKEVKDNFTKGIWLKV